MSVESSDPRALAARRLTGLVQPDRTTCGSSVLVAARMLDDPAYAAYLVNGIDPVTRQERRGTVAERFHEEALAMHRATNAPVDAGGRLQVPWPQALGTLPWPVARQLTSSSGTPYDALLILPAQRHAAFHRVAATVDTGPVVALFVGNRWSARHVVLVIGRTAGTPDAVQIYDPARGRCYPITRADFVNATLDVAGWKVPWFVIAPR